MSFKDGMALRSERAFGGSFKHFLNQADNYNQKDRYSLLIQTIINQTKLSGNINFGWLGSLYDAGVIVHCTLCKMDTLNPLSKVTLYLSIQFLH